MSVLNVIFFLISATAVSCNEYVPVLVWSTQTTEDSYPVIPALSKLSSNEFTDYLLKRVKVENPVILVFMEENLSVEDFSWRDVNGNGAFPTLSNITKMADDVAFLPSVHEPYRGIKKLKNHGYVWRFYEKQGFETLKDGKHAIFEVKLEEPDFLEDRPDMLKKHDEKMAKIYNDALGYSSNVMVIYTGSHTSWIDAELGRFKREEKGNVSSTIPAADVVRLKLKEKDHDYGTYREKKDYRVQKILPSWWFPPHREASENSSLIIISDEKNVVRMTAKPPIVFRKKGSNNDIVVNITDIIGTPTIQDTKEGLIMRVRFPPINNEDTIVNFKFNCTKNDWWTLISADMKEQQLSLSLKPSVDIGGPSGYSFFCNPEIVFGNTNISFTFENFQVQPHVDGKEFGPIIHCINFFSIGILSGLLIVAILGIVLAWGITMIMDINTNDRFDDPKGKTITITATD